MVQTIGFICGIGKVQGQTVYRLLLMNYDTETKTVKGGSKTVFTEQEFIRRLQGDFICSNATLNDEKNAIKASTGSFDRFAPVNKERPLILLSEIQTTEGVTMGYRVANFDGAVKKWRNSDVTAYCDKCKANGTVAFQNAIHKGTDTAGKAIISAYGGATILIEQIKTAVNKNVVPAAPINTTENAKNFANKENVFDDKQIIVLNDLKLAGYNPAIIANPKLSANQMLALSEGIKMGVDVKAFADPAYSSAVMRYLIATVKAKVDISQLLNPNYDVAQLTELTLGIISGVDIQKFSNPKLAAKEMGDIREELEEKLWSEATIRTLKAWNNLTVEEAVKTTKNKKATISKSNVKRVMDAYKPSGKSKKV